MRRATGARLAVRLGPGAIAALAALAGACTSVHASGGDDPASGAPPPTPESGLRAGTHHQTSPAEPAGWYRTPGGNLALVTRGPDGGLRWLDFEGAEFAALAGDPAEGLRWTIDGTERTVDFPTGPSGNVRALRWTTAADTVLLPRVEEGPFRIRDVRFPSDSVVLAGSLLLPSAPAPGSPGAAIVHGSGASDRDNVWAFHIAAHLAASGVAVLVPDKRGSGASEGDWRAADFHGLGRDALAAVAVVRERHARERDATSGERPAGSRAEGDPAPCVGVVGLSQGGWIAPLAAALDPEVSFVVDVSGAAVRVREQLRHEIRQDLVRDGFSGSDVSRALRLFERADAYAARRSDDTWAAFDSLRSALLAEPLAPFAGALPETRAAWWWEWWRGVRGFDPLPFWRSLDVPALAAYGSEDERDNVPVAESVRRLRSLEGESAVDVRVYEGSGHALGDPDTGWIRTDFLDDLAGWVRAACLAPSGRTPHERLVDSYLAAFNSGDPARLASTLERVYAEPFLAGFGGPEAAAWDRLELRRTYGPLAVHHVDTAASPPIVWTRGTVSRGWVGHQLHLDGSEEPQVVRHVIWRVRPHPIEETGLSPTQVADSMRAYLGALERQGLFSGQVTLSRSGDVVLSEAWGRDRRDSPRPITGSTRFHTASVTKLVTAVALLRLVEDGTVSLDQTLGDWIPEYPSPWAEEVTIRHLLTHTSGIELDDDPAYLEAVRGAGTAGDLLEAQIRHLAGREPRPPGTYDYASEGFDLAGVVIERAAGRPWTEAVERLVLRPARMADTRFSVPLDEGRWALGFTSLEADLQTATPGVPRPAPEVLPTVAKPSSGLWSTADDLHRFTRSLLEGRLVGPPLLDSILGPVVVAGEFPRYGLRSWTGLGAQGEDVWGVRSVGHGGVVPGYSAAIEYFPESGWLLTVTSNSGEATGYLVFQRMLELIGGPPRSGAPGSSAVPPARPRAGPEANLRRVPG